MPAPSTSDPGRRCPWVTTWRQRAAQAARHSSPRRLNVLQFLRSQQVVEYSDAALASVADPLDALARAENRPRCLGPVAAGGALRRERTRSSPWRSRMPPMPVWTGDGGAGKDTRFSDTVGVLRPLTSPQDRTRATRAAGPQ